jgi:hypothetical protein
MDFKMNPEEVFGKEYDYFEEIDPFNPKNRVRGYISRKSSEYYGALIITGINDRFINSQLIMAVPKIEYPFVTLADGTRRYIFPSAKEIEVYEKLDGTSVLAFSYTDGVNKFFSFKTRLRPFLASGGRFGDFLSLWNEVGMPHFEEIKRIMNQFHNVNLAFELYGYRNPHLVIYPNVALDIALLFGITSGGNILSPKDLGLMNGKTTIPIVPKSDIITGDYVYNYNLARDIMNKTLKHDDTKYIGIEGQVWYLHLENGRCRQIKCKPEIIEAIHFSQGTGGINKNSIITTCYNAYENVEVLTYDFVKNLLLEEFSPEVVDQNKEINRNHLGC